MSVTIRVVMNQNVQKAMKRCQAKSLTASGMEIERAMKIVLSGAGGAGHTPSLPGMPPNRQHGELRSSVQSALRGDGEAVLAGATAKYAHAVQLTRTVTPKTKNFLTVPIKREAYGKLARTIPGLFFLRAKSGAYYLARRVGKRLELWYSLRKSVYIEGRPFVKPSLDLALPRIMRHWKGMLRK